ncbi:MAG TPA: hypothetical protein VG455_16025, partial [Acidimicrobiales bacterium]|nr:hypothetical protein [Acidimicrobiales bacterium]
MRYGAGARDALVVVDVHEHRHRKPVRRVRPPEDLDADVEVDGTFFERAHLRLEGEVAQLNVVDRVAGNDQLLGVAGIRVPSAVP